MHAHIGAHTHTCARTHPHAHIHTHAHTQIDKQNLFETCIGIYTHAPALSVAGNPTNSTPLHSSTLATSLPHGQIGWMRIPAKAPGFAQGLHGWHRI